MREAAQAGNPTADYELGYVYENGDGVSKDMGQAAPWYMKGAQLGDAAAEAAVGHLYGNGQQVPDDWNEAAQ